MIELKNVGKSFGGLPVFTGVQLRIEPGECVCIAGPGGSGKTLLTRMLVGLDAPSEGSVEIDGVNMRSLPPPILQIFRRKVGVVFQEPLIMTHATVAETIALPLELTDAPDALVARNTQDLIQRLGLTAKANLYTESLSMSERMLVCIARALISAPMVIVADEPFANLDPDHAQMALQLFMNMQKKGTTVILFTKDPTLAEAIGARAGSLQNGRFTIAQKSEQVTTPVPMQEATPATAVAVSPAEKAPAAPDPAAASPARSIRITSIGSSLG